ncbi:MAG: zinc-binding alcohol dehydrogenase family protein [Propionicimonas sp.]
MAQTMTAIGYTHAGELDDTTFEAREVARPQLGVRDLLVEVAAVSVNPIDTKQRRRVDPRGFRVLGYDAAGVVREVGDEVEFFKAGDEVWYAGTLDRPGSNQQFQVVDERIAGRKPTRLGFAEAAALPLTTITAWECLFERLRLTPDSRGTLLVVGGTGGVGSILLQLAKVRLPGVRVIATASAAKQAWASGLGAAVTIDPHGDLVEQTLALAPDGVDWIFSAFSDGRLPVYAQVLRPFGEVVAIDEGQLDLMALKPKAITWHWESMFARAAYQTPDLVGQHDLLNAVADLVDAGAVRSTATAELGPITPANLSQAHRLIEAGRSVGKLVLAGWE